MAHSQITVSELFAEQQAQRAQLDRIESLLSGQKTVLTFGEAARYMGLSKSYLYKLTSSGSVPFFKPEGKLIFFDREQIEFWLKRNRSRTNGEIDAEAATLVTTQRVGKGGKKR